jgi:RHS repeat-associated protein
MNPFRASHKTHGIKHQNHYLSEQTSGVCLQNIYDYSPFGVSLDGRTVEGDFYRRGFNGMEKDDEFKGKGNSYTTEFRQYDPRIGRWLSVDLLVSKFPNESSYTYCFNSPTILIDETGQSPKSPPGGKVIIYNIWFDKNGLKHSKYLGSYNHNELKVDIIKRVYSETENSTPTAVDYCSRDKYGQIIYETGLYDINEKPNAKELNQIFENFIPKKEKPKKESFSEKITKTAPFLTPGYFEGGTDGVSTAGNMAGNQAPKLVKSLLVFNPIIGSADFVNSIIKNEDMYGQDISSINDLIYKGVMTTVGLLNKNPVFNVILNGISVDETLSNKDEKIVPNGKDKK